MHARGEAFEFVKELQNIIQWSEYRARRDYELKEIVQIAERNGFTDMIVVHEDHKKVNALVICHLGKGPTARFKVTSFVPSKKIKVF